MRVGDAIKRKGTRSGLGSGNERFLRHDTRNTGNKRKHKVDFIEIRTVCVKENEQRAHRQEEVSVNQVFTRVYSQHTHTETVQPNNKKANHPNKNGYDNCWRGREGEGGGTGAAAKGQCGSSVGKST